MTTQHRILSYVCATWLLVPLVVVVDGGCSVHCSAVFDISYEHRLLKRAFDIYGDGCEECKLARPIEMEPETMAVQFGIALIQVKVAPFHLTV